MEVVEHDTPAGKLVYALVRPAHLRPWVDQIWYSAGPMERLRERLLPAPMIEVVVNLGPPIRVLQGRGTEVLRAACTGGLATAPAMLCHPPVHRAIGMRLHPLAARVVFAQPLTSLTDHFATLEELIGRSAADALADACHDAPTIASCMAAAQRWVERRLARAQPDPVVVWTAQRIEASHGAVSMAPLRERTGVTKTRFAAEFRDAFGVTPKVYARLHRFARALALLDARPRSLAEVALDAGYYDQPHMNGEIRALTGLSPRELVGTRNAGGFTISEF